jgi:hypothetical protein
MNLLRQRVVDTGKSYRLLTEIIQLHQYNRIISFLRAV